MSANQANSIAESLIRVCRLYQDIIKDSDAVLLLTNMVIDDKKPDTPGLVKQAIANAKNFQKAKLQQISDIFDRLK